MAAETIRQNQEELLVGAEYKRIEATSRVQRRTTEEATAVAPFNYSIIIN